MAIRFLQVVPLGTHDHLGRSVVYQPGQVVITTTDMEEHFITKALAERTHESPSLVVEDVTPDEDGADGEPSPDDIDSDDETPEPKRRGRPRKTEE